MNKIVFASTNKGKIKEVKDVLNKLNIEVLSLNDFESVEEPIEDGLTFKDNAIIKARYYYDILKLPVLTDDSGLIVKVLGNEPGVYSKRYAKDDNIKTQDDSNIKKLLDKLKDIKDRSAYFKTAMIYFDGINYYETEGILEGNIINEKRGNNGFGYDPIFMPLDKNLTLAELSLEEKNKISHRSKALIKMLDILKTIL